MRSAPSGGEAGMESAGVVIRTLSPRWAGPLGRLFQALQKHGDDRWFHPFPLDAPTARRLARHDGADRYLVATRDGDVLALGMLRGWDEGFAIPSLGIAVDPKARGLGVGRSMMAALHAEARAADAWIVRLTVDRGNERALRLYEALGYRFEDPGADPLVGFLDLGGV